MALAYEEYVTYVNTFGKPAENVLLEARKLENLINAPIMRQYLDWTEKIIEHPVLPIIELDKSDHYKIGKGVESVQSDNASSHNECFSLETSSENKERLQLVLRTLINIGTKMECLDTRFVLFTAYITLTRPLKSKNSVIGLIYLPEKYTALHINNRCFKILNKHCNGLVLTFLSGFYVFLSLDSDTVKGALNSL